MKSSSFLSPGECSAMKAISTKGKFSYEQSFNLFQPFCSTLSHSFAPLNLHLLLSPMKVLLTVHWAIDQLNSKLRNFIIIHPNSHLQKNAQSGIN
ncbi:CLUMA_CG005614, isoform A [Clunio marinus]|uniref:CLUMA_CG005614, isoform A n=1 Tax=Clunio marinus TaxID=568069 RepID=A0A1J1HWY4_9DIPT|nr:CLUMA_CG005614, isoform A [Clunio marinus]